MDARDSPSGGTGHTQRARARARVGSASSNHAQHIEQHIVAITSLFRSITTMEALFFNASAGYLEGVIRCVDGLGPASSGHVGRTDPVDRLRRQRASK